MTTLNVKYDCFNVKFSEGDRCNNARKWLLDVLWYDYMHTSNADYFTAWNVVRKMTFYISSEGQLQIQLSATEERGLLVYSYAVTDEREIRVWASTT